MYICKINDDGKKGFLNLITSLVFLITITLRWEQCWLCKILRNSVTNKSWAFTANTAKCHKKREDVITKVDTKLF